MPFMLDTNVCIRALRNRECHIAGRLDDFFRLELTISSVAVAELYYGCERGKNRKMDLINVENLISDFTIIPFDKPSAVVHARIRSHLAAIGNPIGSHDLQIAASALAHDLTLVTHNTREFSRIPGLRLEDWE